MKLSWGFIASSLYCSAFAARPTVSPETARLILAQRLGLSRFHSIEHADSETLRHINVYGGRQQKLFGGEDSDRSKAHLLLWIEDAEQDEATVVINDGSDRTQDFAISNPPPASDNDRLIQDFISQTESLPERPDPKKQTYTSSLEIEAGLPNNKLELYNEYLSVFRASKSDNFSSEELAKVLDAAKNKAAELGFSTTMVMMPASKTRSKRGANPWGTYDLPSKEARRQNPEAVLSSNPEASSSPNPKVSDLEDFPVIAFAEDQAPVRGILPSCFDSLSACQKLTHNCSSHGECKVLHKRRGSGSNQESVDCFGCACSPTVQEVGENKGKKVTYWGGPACQKKDISVQFWLFVGSGVVLAFLVASAIGMLYSMGSEELPSVIGAGVSGPVRK
ncbi:uncharacterized protein K460DRAFT_297227 [Cucurbitaria berberidis CBS 394.84]|uniref:DUF3844 domain-containing protein n=1 Tax=Cucurbitaria berberidis CBS 394.84 TaxID=1168544 RepID=A0A9P4G6M3_9PLEO|nr:uncharacterized protein K460DRAFT_297227 [Cucurbitaria berberidis CBS 394.84]KAF1839971.1 hypothetical protein K460DRAFT_297227 [Cucurbitaria berberidis CBS 394.84]